jgi:DtxR family Mn-dependent transcriptional regulator
MTKKEKNSISEESEEYLEAIYRLEQRDGSAKTMQLASQLKVMPGSITNTVEHLEKHRLVTHEPYKGVKLTEKGRKLALKIIRRHRLAERLLTDVLHLDWSNVHDEACKLEHNLSETIVKPLEKALGNPQTCPHGNPIPSELGKMNEAKSELLISLNPGEGGVISKITEEKHDLLQYLATLGLVPGASVKIEEKAPFNGPIIVKAMGASYALGRNVASVIWVRKS